MDKNQPQDIRDKEGWAHGVKAVLLSVFGTDTEVRITHGGVSQEIANAQEQVGNMSDEAKTLLKALDTHEYHQPIDDVEDALEAIVRDL